ncbi:MAG TPA: SpoIIE family protein phosphatase [Deltaproteobacteria bacterium]|nr:SpoIIE family protein phosphatase [Deltaproteobacteria bacterium]
MRFRWKLLFLLLIIAILPLIIGRSFGVRAVRNLGEELVSRQRRGLVSHMKNRMQILVDGYSAVLWRGRELSEMALRFQAQEVERILRLADAPVPEKIYFAEDFNQGQNVPADIIPSSFHFRARPEDKMELINVSYSSQVFSLAPGVEKEDVETDIARLSLMTPTYRTISEPLQGLIFWQKTVLKNGLHSAYPGHNGIPSKLDSRIQLWYMQALKDEHLWSDPFVDPETLQIVLALSKPVKGLNGNIAGVTSIVIPVSSLMDRKMLFKNIPPETQAFMGYLADEPDTGRKRIRILAREEHIDLTLRSWRTELSTEWLTSGNSAEFQAMVEDFSTGKNNARRMPFQERDSLWVYGATQTGAFLVLITPYKEFLAPARAAEEYSKGLIDNMISMTGYFGIGIILLVVVLAFLFARTVTRPISIMSEGAKNLADGKFDTRVEIKSRDEFGEMGRVFNSVGPQLLERSQMRQSLELARQVQQNLLPKSDPKVEGLDIAGTSIYCDQTGGDYYDFLDRGANKDARLTVVVGDVSDHGIPSALLMTTARALLRQRSFRKGSLKEIVSDVNLQLTRDTEESGQFMTLFYCEIDGHEKRIKWVRAGHDPAIIYSKTSDSFRVLLGQGIPLGIFGNADYEELQQPLEPGQIILIGTDGIWEARNAEGELFGKEAFQKIVRNNADAQAYRILMTVTDALDSFRYPLEQEDDVTLVVIKVEG